jgi:predicted nuclease of predicted toxin-antitoxin system
MRFLADENFPQSAVAALRALGYDVTWVRLAGPGTIDRDVLRWAIREERILLTFDKDFGELARAAALPPSSGVVLLRLPTPPGAETGRQLAAVIDSRNDWAGHFSIIEPGRVRMRSLGAR